MFEILVYLFENYPHTESCPEHDQLARKLAAAGFEDEDITEALDWLSGLQQLSGSQRPQIDPHSRSFRAYDEEEQAKLGSACRGFVAYLENTGVLNALTREIILERAMALEDDHVSLGKLKVIVLMVLWNQHEQMDSLILEELLSDDDEVRLH